MREPHVYKPPMEAAERGRRRASNWHLAFMLLAVVVIVGVFLVGRWQPPRWFVMLVAGVIAALGTMTVGSLVHALDDLRCHYRQLWTDYAELFPENAARAKFMFQFTPTCETVTSVLRNQAHQVLMYHRQIVELHERGVTSPDADDPDTQLAATKRNFEEKLRALEAGMQHEMKVFHELRDIARWSGGTRFNVRDSWWDYIDSRDLPRSLKRKRVKREASDPLDDVLLDPIGQPAGQVRTPGQPESDLHRAATSLRQASEGLRGRRGIAD